MTGTSNHWQTYHRRWSGLEAPLRPNAEIRAAIVDLVGDKTERVLLLGVTPELALSFEYCRRPRQERDDDRQYLAGRQRNAPGARSGLASA